MSDVDPRSFAPPGLSIKPQKQPMRVGPLLVGLAGIACIGLLLIYGYYRADQGGGTIPVIKADASPVKRRPDNPGGMEVPFQDKMIFDKLSGNNNDAEVVEHLIPPPEDPLPRPVAPAIAPVDSKPAQPPITENNQGQPVDAVVPPVAANNNGTATLPPAQPPVKTDNIVKPATNPQQLETLSSVTITGDPLINSDGTAKPVVEKPPEKNVTAAKTPAPETPKKLDQEALSRLINDLGDVAETQESKPSVASKQVAEQATPITASTPIPTNMQAGNWWLQLASLRDVAQVNSEWQRLRRTQPAALQGMSLRVVKAEVPEKGVFYRMQAGPINQAQAQKICQELKVSGISCIAVAK
ncbi:MAG: SPOR domain-containing protein [Alphaproteobacteria bacterium]